MTRPVQALYLGTELFSDMTIAVSAAVKDRLTGWGIRARKLTVIPNGVDLDRVAYDRDGGERVRAELGIGADEYVVLLLGRLDQNKRFDLAIEAAAPSLRPSARVVVVGGGAEREHLAETALRHGVADRVVFAGERHDIAAVLSAADLLVASSRQETFGLSVLEALANGVRVLYTTCPALDGIHAELARRVPSTVAGMGEAIAAAIAAGRGQRKPEQAVADEFGIGAVTSRIDNLYERLASRRSWRTTAARLGYRVRYRTAWPGQLETGQLETGQPGPDQAETTPANAAAPGPAPLRLPRPAVGGALASGPTTSGPAGSGPAAGVPLATIAVGSAATRGDGG